MTNYRTLQLLHELIEGHPLAEHSNGTWVPVCGGRPIGSFRILRIDAGYVESILLNPQSVVKSVIARLEAGNCEPGAQTARSTVSKTILDGWILGMLGGEMIGLFLGVQAAGVVDVPLGYTLSFFSVICTIAGAVGGYRVGVIVIETG